MCLRKKWKKFIQKWDGSAPKFAEGSTQKRARSERIHSNGDDETCLELSRCSSMQINYERLDGEGRPPRRRLADPITGAFLN
jgi:hypothetical protein